MFNSEPNSDRVGTHVPLLKVDRGRPIQVLALSRMEGCDVHFEGRSRLCPGSGVCKLCGMGRPTRYLGFAMVRYDEKRWLLRLTAQAAVRCLAYPIAPGRVYELHSKGEKRPLDIAYVRAVKIPPQEQIVERAELLRLVMGLHGLGVPSHCDDIDDLLHEARSRAIIAIDGELLLPQTTR